MISYFMFCRTFTFCIILMSLFSCTNKSEIKKEFLFLKSESQKYLSEKWDFKLETSANHSLEKIVNSSFIISCKNNLLTVREIYPFIIWMNSNNIFPSVELYSANSIIKTNVYIGTPEPIHYEVLGDPIAVVRLEYETNGTILNMNEPIFKAEAQLPDGKYFMRIGLLSPKKGSVLEIFTTSYANKFLDEPFSFADLNYRYVSIEIKNGSLADPVRDLTFFCTSNNQYQFILLNEFEDIEKGEIYFQEVNDFITSSLSFLENKFHLIRIPCFVNIIDKASLYIQKGNIIPFDIITFAYTSIYYNELKTRTIYFSFSSKYQDSYIVFLSEIKNAFFKSSPSGFLSEGLNSYLADYSAKKTVYMFSSLNPGIKKFLFKYFDKISTDYIGLDKLIGMKDINEALRNFNPEVSQFFLIFAGAFISYFIDEYGYEKFIKFYYSLDPHDLDANSIKELEEKAVLHWKEAKNNPDKSK
ncbi:MAG: hypothetical protein A2014_03065 [Spirochaetes bacterium GWF1_49_6]|nr:MAG: hypothetical protein A2014_03065 [Spirochaetes bacterium GWF1_49_6]